MGYIVTVSKTVLQCDHCYWNEFTGCKAVYPLVHLWGMSFQVILERWTTQFIDEVNILCAVNS